MSRRGKSPTDDALNDMHQFMSGQRDFEDGVLYSRDAPRMWQCGYHSAIRAKPTHELTLKQRLLISRVKPRFANSKRRAVA